eukprot:scaffold121752_cov29-Tisochrysis_lutea.AAC.11
MLTLVRLKVFLTLATSFIFFSCALSTQYSSEACHPHACAPSGHSGGKEDFSSLHRPNGRVSHRL